MDGAGLWHNVITLSPMSLSVSFYPSLRIAHHREPLFIGMPPVTFCIVIYSANLFACPHTMCAEHPRLSYVPTRSLVFIIDAHTCFVSHSTLIALVAFIRPTDLKEFGHLSFRTHARTRASSPGKFVAGSISYFCFSCLRYVWLQFFASSDVITHPSIQFFSLY